MLRAKGYAQQTPQYIRPLNLQHKLAGPFSPSRASATTLWMPIRVCLSGVSFCRRHPRTPSSSASQTTTPSPTWQSCPRKRSLQESAKLYRGWRLPGFGIHRKSGVPGVLQVLYSGGRGCQVGGRFWGTFRIGEVTIYTGDYVLGDRDGIVIIPGAITEEVVQQTEEVLRTENLVRKAILQGLTPPRRT